MLKKLGFTLALAALLSMSAMQATAGPVTKGDVQRLNLDQLTLNGHTITAAEFNVLDGVTPGTVLASAAVIVDSSKNISSFNNLGLAGTETITRAPGADSAATDNGSKILLTAPVDTTGTNTHNGWDLALTVGNATGGTNTVNGWKFENYTGDAQVNVNAINIGTSDGLGTANAITVGSGWDLGFTSASPVTITSTLGVSGVLSSGLSGTAGEVDIFPATASNGKLILSAINNAGAFNTTITNSNSGQATVWTTPDAGAATQNFVGDTMTQTLSGKTLTSPKITGPVAVACGSTCTLGTANLGTYTKLDTAGGSAATLPTATGTGNTYKLYISVATTSAQDKVLLNTVTDTIIGTAIGENAGTAKIFVGNAGTFHSLQMPFAGTQPSGGFIGDSITCTDVASTIWKCDVVYQAGTTPTTPYSASTT